MKSKEDELKQKIATLEATVETMTEVEKNLKDEISLLQAQLAASKKDNEELNKCVQKTEFDKVGWNKADIIFTRRKV